MSILNFVRKHLGIPMKFEVDAFVEKYCQGNGLEIGGAAYQEYNIKALNLDIAKHDDENDVYRIEQIKRCGKVKQVDIVASGDNIPVAENSFDFVFSSHVLEHFYNPLSALREWKRVVKNNGYIVAIVPSKNKTFDRKRKCTTIEEFYQRDKDYDKSISYQEAHHTVWLLKTFKSFAKEFEYELVDYINYPSGMKNSFIVAIRVKK